MATAKQLIAVPKHSLSRVFDPINYTIQTDQAKGHAKYAQNYYCYSYYTSKINKDNNEQLH